jgi:hypothetical protein
LRICGNTRILPLRCIPLIFLTNTTFCMNILIRRLSCCLCLIALHSCISCGIGPISSGTSGTLTPRVVSELKPDSLSFIYFSFDSDTTIAATQANTDAWDIRLPQLSASSRSVDVVLNSGNVNPNGKTLGIVIDSTFDLLFSAPLDSALRADDTASAKRVMSIDLFGKGMFNYNSSTRTITPNPQKTLVLKTRTGKYVKVQFVNLYKDAVASPTMFTPLGYYRLRYVKNTTRVLK